jgi:phosphoglycerate dehydrogenase-like enzyme
VVRAPLDPDLKQAVEAPSEAHVSVHTSHSLTHGLIGHDALAHARGSNLINTADPSIVQPEALLEALDKGWIRRAPMEGRYPDPVSQTRTGNGT